MENCNAPITYGKQGVYVFTFSIFVFVFILLFLIISVKCTLLVILCTELSFYFEQFYFTSVSAIDLLEVNLQDVFGTKAFRLSFGFVFDVFPVILLALFFSVCLLASAVSLAISD